MGFSFEEFPNVSYHDADLRELIRLYNQLADTYNNLQNEIQEVLNYIDTFEQTTDAKIKQEITITMSLYTQRLINVENLVHELEQTISTYPNQFKSLQTQIDSLTADLKRNTQYLTNLHQELLQEFHNYKNGMSDYVDGRLQAFEEEIRHIVTKLDRLDVTNPINGKYEDINIVLNDIYKSIQLSFAITAIEYDKLGITAREYDNLKISAIDYSTKAYFIFWELRQGLMRSPFTGKNTHYSNIIYQLANLHKCALTAKQYDDLNMTALEFDAWNITAFNYDWFGKQMLLKREGITAKAYDDLRLSAEKYDSKKLTAGEYDIYGNAILTNTAEIKACQCMSCNSDVLKPNGQR